MNHEPAENGSAHEPAATALRWPAVLLTGLMIAACSGNPPAPPPPTQSNRNCAQVPDHYRVKRGDTLFRIAWSHCVDYRDLARWNRLRDPDLILVGQQLRLQGPAAASSRRATRPPPRRAAVRTPPANPPRVTTDAGREKKSLGGKSLGGKPLGGKPLALTDTARWGWPARGEIVSRFKPGEPGGNGIRIKATRGQRVRAASPGLIVYTGNSLPGYGTLIIVEHQNGLLSAYGHLGKPLVKKGDRVGAGDAIAELSTGGSGDAAAATLHFEIRKDGQPVNPLRYLPG